MRHKVVSGEEVPHGYLPIFRLFHVGRSLLTTEIRNHIILGDYFIMVLPSKVKKRP